jgi:hypothetical protein
MPKTALITGAGSGIGRGFALALARRGFHLLLVGWDASRLQDVAREVGAFTTASYYCADLSDLSACSRLVDSILDDHGAPDLLVNNAALMPAGDFIQRSAAEMEATFNVNLLAPAELTRRFCASATPPEGVIFVLSTAARFPQPYNSVYSASKAGLRSLAESLQVEFAGEIRIFRAYPPLTATDMTDRFADGHGSISRADPVRVAERIVAAYESGRDEISWLDWEVIPSLFYRLAPRLFRQLLKSQRRYLQEMFNPSKKNHEL